MAGIQCMSAAARLFLPVRKSWPIFDDLKIMKLFSKLKTKLEESNNCTTKFEFYG